MNFERLLLKAKEGNADAALDYDFTGWFVQ